MSEPPRVSVIITTYNRAASLVEAVESVLAQTFADLEIIVADDGSTDETAARLAQLGAPILYERVEHGGSPARTRNAALRRARGDLVAFLDDDDRWRADKLARQVAVIDADPDVGLVYSGFSIRTDDGSVHVPQLAPWQADRGPLLDRLLLGCFIHPSTVLLRRTLLDRAGGFDERRRVAEDYDLWLRLAPLTLGMCVPAPLACLRRGDGNLSVREQALVYATTIAILEERRTSRGFGFRRRLRCRRAIANLRAAARQLAYANDP